MTVFQRIRSILFALLMLFSAAVIIVMPADAALILILLILAFGLAIKGIKDISFYFVMARHMVGGKIILYQGVIVLNFALLTLSFSDIPKIFIMMYLIGIHAFSGVIEVLRAMEARKTVEGPWKLKFSHGAINLALAAACLIFIGYLNISVLIYSAGLIYSAVIRIISSFRKTAFVLIK